MFLVGLVGNTLVIYVVLRYTKMQTVTNLYILNLAVADFTFLIGIPFIMTTMGLGFWPFGNVMCKVITVYPTITNELEDYADVETMMMMIIVPGNDPISNILGNPNVCLLMALLEKHLRVYSQSLAQKFESFFFDGYAVKLGLGVGCCSISSYLMETFS